MCKPKPHPSNWNWHSLLLQIFRTSGQEHLHYSYHLTLVARPKFHWHQSCQQLEAGPWSTHAWWTEWDYTVRQVSDAIRTQDRQWSSGMRFVQTQVQTTHVYTWLALLLPCFCLFHTWLLYNSLPLNIS